MRRHHFVLFALSILAVLTTALSWQALAEQTGEDGSGSEALLAQGEEFFEERSYRQAAEAYTAYLEQVEAVNATTNRVRSNLAIAYVHLRKFDEVFATLEELAARNQGERYEALAHRQAMLTRLSMPSFYFEKDGQRHWGRRVQQGTRHNVAEHNRHEALRHIARAYEVLAARDDDLSQARPLLRMAELGLFAQVTTEYADVLESHDEQFKRETIQLTIEKPDGEHDFKELAVPMWPNYERVMRLYDEAAELYEALGELGAGEETVLRAGKALFAKALFVDRVEREYRALKAQWGDVLVEGTLPEPPEARPYFEAVIERYPHSKRAPRAWFLIAERLKERGELVEALRVLEELSEAYPDSRWAESARAIIQQETAPRLEVELATTLPIGESPAMSVRARNTEEVALSAYELDLASLVQDEAFILDHGATLSSMSSLYRTDGEETVLARHLGETLHRWQIQFEEDGTHAWHEREDLELPLDLASREAYDAPAILLKAESSGLTQRSLHVLGDATAIVRANPNQLTHWLVDNRDGAPLGPATVVMRQRWRVFDGESWTHKVMHSEHRSDDAGITVLPRHDRPSGYRNMRLLGTEIIAISDCGRAAVTNPHRPGARFSHRIPRTRRMIYTDRPVYRPEQTVHFKGISRHMLPEGYRPLSSDGFQYRVRDPRGETVAEDWAAFNEFGTTHGSFELPAGATLGRYRIQFRHGNRTVASQTFRVEEYVLPEYEVIVEPDEETVPLGEEANATIRVEYYGGGPVAGAEVSYRVFRRAFRADYRPARRGDFFFSNWRYQRASPRGRVLVEEAEARADENGEVTVRFPTEQPEDPSRFVSQRYEIVAEATDESRRVITGEGHTVISTHQFAAYMHTERNLYHVEDRVPFTLRVQTPAGDPVSAPGTIKLGRLDEYWVSEVDEEGRSRRVKKRDEEFFTSLEVQTRPDGYAELRIPVQEAGQYTAHFISEDAWGNEIVAYTDFVVADENGNVSGARFAQLELIPERRVYSVGETARFALTSSVPDVTVMVMLDYGQEPQRQLVHIPGTARTIEFDIHGSHAPNFWVSAYAIHDNRFQRTREEIFILPEPKFLDIEIDTVQSEYRPGEEAEFTVRVRDHEGNPVDAELSLGVVDGAIYYIAADRTPDPRTRFHRQRRRFHASSHSSLEFRSQSHLHSANEYPVYDLSRSPMPRERFARWTRATFEARRDQPGTATEYGLQLVGTEHISADRYEVEERDSSSWPSPRRMADPTNAQQLREPSRARGGSGGHGALGHGGNFGGGGGAADEAEPAEAEVRDDFRETAHWEPRLRTGEDGTATSTFRFPDNLTRWNVRAIAVDQEDRFGLASVTVNTAKNIEVRMRAPRFFVERDEVVLTAVVRNQFEQDKESTLRLDLPDELELLAGYSAEIERTIPGGGRTSVDWRVRVVEAGMPTVRMSALTTRESDAQELTFPARVYGAPVSVVRSGVIRADSASGEASMRLEIPEELDERQTRLRLSLQPSVLSSALEAIPYLIDYPYGSMDQTMSRFMPAVAVRQTLKELGIDLEEVAHLRKELDLSNVPIRHRGAFRNHPVFDDEGLDAVIRAGLARIRGGQTADGGWGWWPGARVSSAYMSAYVLQALEVARRAGVDIEESMMRKAHDWLAERLADGRDSLHLRAYMTYVLAKTRSLNPERDTLLRDVTRTYLYERRDELTNYTRALLALTTHKLGFSEKSEVLARNMMSYIEIDEENRTARFPEYREFGWWFWYRDRIEASAWSIRALLRIAPEHESVPMLMRWLANNRDGNAWRSTKGTAFAVLAINEYAHHADELDPDYTVTVYVNGERKRSVAVTAENMFALPNADLYFSGKELAPGSHEIKLVREGRGSCYFTAHLEYFSEEDHIEAQASEIGVQRTYYRLVPTRHTDEDGKVRAGYERVRLEAGEKVRSGELIEVELEIECLNDYEYLAFEDPKPAGMEPVRSRSGYRNFDGVWGYIEYRDETITTFVARAEQGTIRYSYRLRAEIPGTFHALPVQAYGMYSPDLRANSDSAVLTIYDRE